MLEMNWLFSEWNKKNERISAIDIRDGESLPPIQGCTDWWSKAKALTGFSQKKPAVTLWVKPEQIGHGEELFSFQINHKKKSASERKGTDLDEQDTDGKKRHCDSTFSTLLGLANPLLKPAIEALKL